MRLAEFYGGIEVHREEKIIFVSLLRPHRVLSTSRSSAGGLRDDLLYIYNHQSCEPAGGHMVSAGDPDEYKRLIAGSHDLPFQRSASLGTAANMNCAAICHERFRELEVVTICTAGVERNACRAGDPASYYDPPEEGGQPPAPGTINAMIFINRELTPGAMVTSVVTATEAKTAALQELEIPSRYSEGLATGTGTDQIAIASMIGGRAASFAGKHSKVGELIGRGMHDALRRALELQNGLTPSGRCSCLAHLERLGAERAGFCEGVGEYLSRENAALFESNFDSVTGDPLTVAALASLVHLRDKLLWNVLPESCAAEVMAIYGAQVSAAVSGKGNRAYAYLQTLSALSPSLERNSFLDFVYQAFALGFSEKWS